MLLRLYSKIAKVLASVVVEALNSKRADFPSALVTVRLLGCNGSELEYVGVANADALHSMAHTLRRYALPPIPLPAPQASKWQILLEVSIAGRRPVTLKLGTAKCQA